MAVAYNAAATNIGPFGGVGSGATLKNVIVGTGAAGTLTIYNGQSAAAGALVAVIDTATANYYEFDAQLTQGLFAVQTGTAKLSIVYE